MKKPQKPTPDFPLFPHATGRWCKKIQGKFHYFGPWDKPDEALQSYLRQNDDLHTGRVSKVSGAAAGLGNYLILQTLCDRFLSAKRTLLRSEELSQRMYEEYLGTCDLVMGVFGRKRKVMGLGPEDFIKLREGFAKRWGPHRLAGQVQRTRTLFKWAFDSDLIDRPVKFGPTFKKPSAKTMRIHRAAVGEKMFESEEIRRMLIAASPTMKAMVLLGINAGFGNTDVAALEWRHIPGNGWVYFSRPKTGVSRRCPLFIETVVALEVIGRSGLGRVFFTQKGNTWDDSSTDSPVSKEFAKLLRKLGIHRQGVGFYALRKTFKTVADGAKDPLATRFLMGHSPSDIGDVYTERIDNDRLVAVVEYVREWLFGDK